MSIHNQLVSGVFYTSISKYAGIVIMLVVVGILSRMFDPVEFGILNIATVIIAFFAIFSDLGIGPAIIQHKTLAKDDLNHIFSLTVWVGLGLSLLFYAGAGAIAEFYREPEMENPHLLASICRILSVNLFFASVNIVPNAMVLKDQRFRFAAVRSVAVQLVGGAAGITAAYSGMGIYALTINPIFSSILLFAINFREYPLRLHLWPKKESLRKVFSFSVYQFSFQLINYFSRNLDKLLMGRMSLADLGYYDKSYRLMMLPLQNIAYVVSPVMHPVFASMQDDRQKLAHAYMQVVRLLAFIGMPLSAVIFFTSPELILIAFGDQWLPSIPVLQILSLSVGIQIVMSTSGAIFQAANAPKMLFICGLLSAILNVAAICIGIFVFKTMEAVAWSICISFSINFLQTYYTLFRLTLHTAWGSFWRSLISPLALTALLCLPLGALQMLLPQTTPALLSLTIKGFVALGVWLAYIHLRGEYDLRKEFRRLTGKTE